MISIIEGFGVGAGKSYFATTQLLQHFLDGGTAYVADTMQLKWEPFKAYVRKKYQVELEDDQYHVLNGDEILHVHENTPPGTEDCPVLIVIDEAHGALNARDWADRKKRPLFDWCTQSRHDDNDLLFISQSAHNIDKQLRRIATYNWRIRNSEKLGEGNPLKMWLNVWRALSFGLHGGPQFIVNQLDQDGVKPLGKKIFLPQDKDIFAIYESKSMRGKHKRAGVPVARKQLKKVGAKAILEKRPYMKYLIYAVIAVLCLAGWRLAHTDWSFGAKKQQEKVATVSATPGPSTSPGATAYDIEHEEWRARGKDWIKLADTGLYRVGRMSRKGMVRGIQDGVILVDRPDRRLLYIVAEESKAAPVIAAAPIPSPTATPGKPIIAEWHPEQNRLTEEKRNW